MCDGCAGRATQKNSGRPPTNGRNTWNTVSNGASVKLKSSKIRGPIMGLYLLVSVKFINKGYCERGAMDARLPDNVLYGSAMDAKSILSSKTFWFNVLALVITIASAFGYASFTADPKIDQYALVAVTLINLVLRFVTVQPVKL
jgi:hypothetical protein